MNLPLQQENQRCLLLLCRATSGKYRKAKGMFLGGGTGTETSAATGIIPFWHCRPIVCVNPSPAPGRRGADLQPQPSQPLQAPAPLPFILLSPETLASLPFTVLCKLWGPAGWKCSLFLSRAAACGFYSPKITSRWSRAHITAQKPHGSCAGKGSWELLK